MRLSWMIVAIQALARYLRLGSTKPALTTSQKTPDVGDIDGQNAESEGPPSSEELDSETTHSNPPRDNDDQDHSLPGTCTHSETEDPEGLGEGNASNDKPQRTNQDPYNIPGRRGEKQPNSKQKSRPKSSYDRLDLICRKNHTSTTWSIILTAEDECRLSSIRLEGELPITGNQEWQCPSFSGKIVATFRDNKQRDVPLFERDPLIFKMRKYWSGEGRKIARITSGYFIVIVPKLWERKDHAPVEPDDCSDSEFQAHYFHRQVSTTDEFVDGFHEWSGSLVATGIALTGRRVFDDSDEGDLFAGNVPSLRPVPEFVSALVGEETKDGWRQSFHPSERSLADVLSDRQGRFFLRVYDKNTSLLDSIAFRYLPNLLEIRVNGTVYTEDMVIVPTPSGHSPTKVCFVGVDDSAIVPILPTKALQDAIRADVLEVPPNPDTDQISCRLATDANGVGIVLNLPRIWWRLEESHAETYEWRDTPITVTRQGFRKYALSNASMVLLSRRFPVVLAGFNHELIQPYKRLINDESIVIPLAHFVDHEQIDRSLREDAHFNVKLADEIVPIVVICADPMPEIISFTADPAVILVGDETVLKWSIQNAGDAHISIQPEVEVIDSDGTVTVRPVRTTRYTLTLAVSEADSISSTVTVAVEQMSVQGRGPVPRVMSSRGKWRCGKGFSIYELQAAGLAVRKAADRSIPIDRRRRTSHQVNIESVRSFLDE